jgi:hypothetical protein
MNGAHAELFSFVLHLELDSESVRKRLAPLYLKPYASVTMTEYEPCFTLAVANSVFVVFSTNNQIRMQVSRENLSAIPEVERMLVDDLGFEGDKLLARNVPREQIKDLLFQLADRLKSLVPVS